MKFVFGILFAAFVAVAFAEDFKRPEFEPVAPESPVNVRDKRGFILTPYAAPVATLPVRVAATEEATKRPEIANLPAPIEKKETYAAIPAAAAIATPYAYTYSAAIPYAYPAYTPYVPYYYNYPAFIY